MAWCAVQCSMILACAAILGAASPPAAPPPQAPQLPEKYQVLDVAITAPVYQRLLEVLDISPDEPAITTLIVEYTARAREIDERTHQRMLKAGQQAIEDLKAQQDKEMAAEAQPHQKVLIREKYQERIREEMQKSRHAYRNEEIRGLKEHDAARAEFFATLQERFGLTDAATACLERLARRDSLMVDYTNEDDLRYRDVYFIVRDAGQEGGELHALLRDRDPQRLVLLQLQRTVEPAGGTLGDILAALDAYERGEDEGVKRRMAQRREPVLPGASVSTPSTDPEFAKQMKEMAEGWASRFIPAWECCQRVAQVLQEESPETATLWTDRFHRAFFPNLAAERWCEKLSEWLAAQPDATAEQVAAARVLEREFIARRRALEAAAMAVGISAKKEKFLVDFHMTDPDDIEYAERKLAIHQLSWRTVQALSGILITEQRARLRERLYAPAAARGQARVNIALFGPEINVQPLRMLNAVDAYHSGGQARTPAPN